MKKLLTIALLMIGLSAYSQQTLRKGFVSPQNNDTVWMTYSSGVWTLESDTTFNISIDTIFYNDGTYDISASGGGGGTTDSLFYAETNEWLTNGDTITKADSSWVSATIGTLDVDIINGGSAVLDSFSLDGGVTYVDGFDDSDTLDIGTLITPKIKAEGEPLYFEDSENTTPLSLSELVGGGGSDSTFVTVTADTVKTSYITDNGSDLVIEATGVNDVNINSDESVDVLAEDVYLRSTDDMRLRAAESIDIESESGIITAIAPTYFDIESGSGVFRFDDETIHADGTNNSTENTAKFTNYIGNTLEVEKTTTDTVIVAGDTVTSIGNAQTIIESIDFDSLTAGQFLLSGLNTAPATSSSTGTLGEIKIDENYIYICVATDTWKRVSIATW